jgi:hypothetical protein
VKDNDWMRFFSSLKNANCKKEIGRVILILMCIFT